MRIRVCDDVPETADEWVSEIRDAVPGNYDVARMADTKGGVSNLLLRKIAVEKGELPLAHESEFDDIDILVVDYDLLHLDETGSRTTGEGVARLARSYSTCGTIVVMNQFKGPQFDLGMRGHLDSYADTNIDASLVGCPALWKAIEPSAGHFNPTVWTPMPTLLDSAKGLAAKLATEGVDVAVMALLGLAPGALAELSDTAFGFLSLKAETAEELSALTVRDFLARCLDDDVAQGLLEKAPHIVTNFAAFRLVKWLERAVLRPMDVLIDGAHLVDRLPFLIDSEKGDATDPAHWVRAAAKPEAFLRWDLLGQYHNELASRAQGKTVFDWFRLANDDQLDELQDAYLENPPDRFFLAEDTSAFVEKGSLTRYRADFHNFGDRRGIEMLGGITYGPLRRIRFG